MYLKCWKSCHFCVMNKENLFLHSKCQKLRYFCRTIFPDIYACGKFIMNSIYINWQLNPLSPGVLGPGNYPENPLIYGVFSFEGKKMKFFENVFFNFKSLYLSQILTDWALVFCKHPQFLCGNGFCIEKVGSFFIFDKKKAKNSRFKFWKKLPPQHCLWPNFFIAVSFSTQKLWMFAKN